MKLTGPSDEIAKIRDNGVKVWAELRPTVDELEAGNGSPQLPLYLHLPTGVTTDTVLPRVTITVTKRAGRL